MSHASSLSERTVHLRHSCQYRQHLEPPVRSPFEDPEEMSDDNGGLQRPKLASTGQNSSFRTRALAVAAAHRISQHSPVTSPCSAFSEHLDGIEEVNQHGHGIEHDLEAGPSGSPTSRTAHLFSPGGNKPRYRWLSGARGGGTGDEPGVDVRSQRDEEAYGHLTGHSHVTVVDWTNESDDEAANVRIDFPGERLKEWLASDAGKHNDPESDKPHGVRWIHIESLNWEVIKALTLHYGLHPLAVEDALRSLNSPRSKLDFYRNHLYLQILIHHMHDQDSVEVAEAAEALASGKIDEIVIEDDDEEERASRKVKSKRQDRKSQPKKTTSTWSLPEGVEGVFEPSVGGTRLQGGQSPFQKAAHRLTVDQLSAKYMVPVRRSILSVFMTRDNTMITVAAKPCKEVLQPIYDRLEDDSSLLRRAGDVSMLAQALLDVSVDLAIEIQQTFEVEILKVEATVLVDPQMETVRHLHVLSSQLIRLRRSLAPLLRVCYIVRDQELQRSRAASAVTTTSRPLDRNHGSRDTEWITPQSGTRPEMSRPNTPGPSELGLSIEPGHHGTVGFDFGMSRPSSATNATAADRGGGGGGLPTGTSGITGMPTNQNGTVPWKEPMTMTGYFSPMTKVYIGDVLDHLEIICSSMDQFVATCDHLTDYVFNVLSFQTNASMERLSVVTVIFLPLTFISSYFGMNFEDFGELQNSVSYFWKVAAPCTAAFFVIFSFSYIQTGLTTIYRRLDRWRRTREVEEQMRVDKDRKARRRKKSIW